MNNNTETKQEIASSGKRQALLLVGFVTLFILIMVGLSNRADAATPSFECEVTVVNQFSVHDWTQVNIFENGEFIGMLKNVEREANAVTTGTFTISNPDAVTFIVAPGPSGLSSLDPTGLACELTEIPVVEEPVVEEPVEELVEEVVEEVIETPEVIEEPTEEVIEEEVVVEDTPVVEQASAPVIEQPATFTEIPVAQPAQAVVGSPAYAG